MSSESPDIAVMLADARSLMAACYEATPPSDRYADAGARLIVGTAATESHFRYRRQTVFDWTTERGAWGLWQTEGAAVEDSMQHLASHPVLAMRAAQWLFRQNHATMQHMLSLNIPTMLRLISGWDRLAMLFCRLHYLRCPGPIPATEGQRAAYWKKHYNTTAGKGTPEKYLSDFNRLVQPFIQEKAS